MALIVQYSSLLPSISSGGPCFSATVVGRSLKPTMHQRLGRPLPPPTIYYRIGSSAGGKVPFWDNGY